MPAPTRASAGLAVLDGRRGRARRSARRSASSRRSTAGASTSTRRAARSTSRARATEIGYAPRVGLREGIRRTLDWYRDRRMAVTTDDVRPPIDKAQEQLFAPGTSSRAKYAALVVGRPGLGALLKYELVVMLAQALAGRARAGAAQGAVSVAARVVRPQRRLRSERRAAASRTRFTSAATSSSTTTACSTRRARPTAASASATASSSAATRSCRARTATSSSPTARTSASTARCSRRAASRSARAC